MMIATIYHRSSFVRNWRIEKILIVIFFLSCLQSSAQSYGEPVKILDGFQFVEGPAMNEQGMLFFTDIPKNLIYQYTNDGALSIFLKNTGGANGLAFDIQGRLIACAGGARQIFRLETDGTRTILADSYNGKKLNSPNDLWIDKTGGIYFTDPYYGREKKLEQDGMHVYYIYPEGEKIIRIIDDLQRPNGIIGTPDNRTLYVTDEGARKIYSYNIESPGKVSGKKLFFDDGVDGMALTDNGELVITVEKDVIVCSREGKALHTWHFEEKPTNVCYANRRLYITTQAGNVYKIASK